MDRRSFLRCGSVATLAGIAGCSGGDGGDGSGGDGTPTSTATSTTATTASFGDPTLSVGEPPRVGEKLGIEIVVPNEGTAAGDFTATLGVTGPEEHTRDVRIEGVEPGETGSTTVGIDTGYAGTYTLRLRGTEARRKVRVEPRDVELGEAAALDEALEFSVEDASVEPTLIAEGPGPYYLRGSTPHVLPVDGESDDPAADGQVMLVVEATVTNTGNQARAFDPSSLSLSAAEGSDPSFYPDVGLEVFDGVPISGASASIDGDPLAGVHVPAGETESGWLLAPANRDAVESGSVRLGIQRDGERTDPEVVWQIVPEGGAELPQFEAEALSLPDRVPNATTAEFSVRVTNTGESAGTFRDVLEITAIPPEFVPIGELFGEVGPGATEELSAEFLMAFGGKQGFQLQSSDTEVVDDMPNTDRIDGVEGTCTGWWLNLGFGEEATLSDDTLVFVHSPQYVPGFNLNRRFGVGNRSILIKIETFLPEGLRNRGLARELLPSLDDFEYNYHPRWGAELSIRLRSAKIRQKAKSTGNTLHEPITGPLYPLQLPENPTGGSVEGWAAFRNPQDDYVEELSREERELLLRKPIKTQGDTEKIVAVRWAQKY